jgi:hypothetical protein
MPASCLQTVEVNEAYPKALPHLWLPAVLMLTVLALSYITCSGPELQIHLYTECASRVTLKTSCTAIGTSGLAAGNRPLGAQFCSAAVDGFAPCTVAPMTSRSSPSALGDACLKCCHDTRLPSRKRSRWQLISRHHSWPMDCSMIASAVHADSAQLLQLRTAAVDPCISFAQLPARSVKGRHILVVLIVQNGRCLGRCCQRRLATSS